MPKKTTALHRIIFQRAPSLDEVQQAQKLLTRAATLPAPKLTTKPIPKKLPATGSREEKTATLQNEGTPRPAEPARTPRPGDDLLE